MKKLLILGSLQDIRRTRRQLGCAAYAAPLAPARVFLRLYPDGKLNRRAAGLAT
jgi:hypothetical protein